MSVRLLTLRVIKHGRHFLQSYWKRDIHTNIFEQNQNRARQRLPVSGNVLKSTNNVYVARNALQTVTNSQIGSHARSSIFRFGQHARKLFIDNILSRVTTTYSQELRQHATKRLFYGDSAPFFALVGVSLASGAGLLTKEDELEGVCWEIREAASRLQSTWSYDEITETLDARFNVDKLDIGPPIAKGCAAVVYAASIKTEKHEQMNIENLREESAEQHSQRQSSNQVYGPELLSPIQNMSRFVHNFGGSVDNLNVYNQSAAAFALELAAEQQRKEQEQQKEHERIQQEAHDLKERQNYRSSLHELDNSVATIQRYPLALKMMFNYDIQSNALSILRAMYRETVPARQRLHMHVTATRRKEEEAAWERFLREATVELPPHPNIVCMYGYFCDEVKALPEGSQLYPVAQPPRINPDGYGRNMSLYLLMKRYDYSLRSLLNEQELSMRTKLLLFTQLLEAVVHLERHGIAHRDIKSDNLLVELIDGDDAPLLVLSDFGCCLADRTHGLQLPFSSMDIDKGGNAALMAPEIINKKPGPFAVLNYAKADLWACGAIAYEIFGQQNPFYTTARMEQSDEKSLRNCDYKHNDLPKINDVECPELVQQLINNILHPNPAKRVSPDIAANIMQLFLWSPSKWLKSEGGNVPNSPEILQWLLSLSSKVMCEGRAEMNNHNFGHKGRRTYVEYLLLCSFLSRVRLRRVRGALNWIHQMI